jgi:DNA polymerase III subunit chi
VTRIDFYRYAEDKLRFACRLSARAFEKSSRLIVYSPDAERLREFDRLLWTYNATKFVPHCMQGAAVEPETPIVLAAKGDALPHHDVLLNLSDEWPPFFSSFERLLEIVSTDDADKERARGRWTFYKQRGYDLTVHDVEG